VIYTPWSNLKVWRQIPRLDVLPEVDAVLTAGKLIQKTGDMAVGQVSFHNEKKVGQQQECHGIFLLHEDLPPIASRSSEVSPREVTYKGD
jgi:hypothetical protein